MISSANLDDDLQDLNMNSTNSSNDLSRLLMDNLTETTRNLSNTMTDLFSTTTDSATNAPPTFAEIYEDIQSSVRVLVPFFFGVIAVTGFFGNVLVILVVTLNKTMHSTTNLLIANLAIADLLFVVFCVPFTATDYVTDYWPFGDFWCRSVQYLIVVTAFASIYTLVLMSIDRFLAVVHPIRSRMLRTEHITKIAIFTLWTVILTISSPVLMVHEVLFFVILALALAGSNAGVVVAPVVPVGHSAVVHTPIVHHGAHAVHSHVVHHPAPVKVVTPIITKPVVAVHSIKPVVPLVPVHHATPAVVVHH